MSSTLTACAEIKGSCVLPSDVLGTSGVMYLLDLLLDPPQSAITLALLADGHFDRQPDKSWIDFEGSVTPGRDGFAMTVVADMIKASVTCVSTHSVSVMLGKVLTKHSDLLGCLTIGVPGDPATRLGDGFKAVLQHDALVDNDFSLVLTDDWATIKGKLGELRLIPGGRVVPTIIPSDSYVFWCPLFGGRMIKRSFRFNDPRPPQASKGRRGSFSGGIQLPIDLEELENASEWYWDGEGLPPSSWYDPHISIRAASAPPAFSISFQPEVEEHHSDGSEGSEDGARTPPSLASDGVDRDPLLSWGHRGSTTSTEGIPVSAARSIVSRRKVDE